MPRLITAQNLSARFGGHDTEGAEVVLAALDHLQVVDAGELGVGLPGVVGGADEGGAQQRGPGLGHGLSLVVGVAGLGGLGDQTGEGPELLAPSEAGGVAHGSHERGPADVGDTGQGTGEFEGVDPSVGGLPFDGVSGELGLHGSQEPDSVAISAARSANATAGWAA
jgi:hypothetical protein